MRHVITSICVLFFTFGTFAQEFSPEWKTVPNSFVGLGIKDIHAKLLAATSTFRQKDEFETTAAFEKRRADKSGILLGDKLTAADLLVFTYSPERLSPSQNGLVATYNADTEFLKVQIKDEPMRYLGSDSQGKIEQRQYHGLNMSPVELKTKTVGFRETRTLSQYSIAISNRIQFIQGRNHEISFDLKMTPDVARSAKENLSILIAGKLASPYNGLELDKIKATLERLYDLESLNWYLIMDVSAIWVYNRKTGEIYQKYTPAN